MIRCNYKEKFIRIFKLWVFKFKGKFFDDFFGFGYLFFCSCGINKWLRVLDESICIFESLVDFFNRLGWILIIL